MFFHLSGGSAFFALVVWALTMRQRYAPALTILGAAGAFFLFFWFLLTVGAAGQIRTGSPAPPAEEETEVRLSVANVTLALMVSDAGGKPLRGLGAEDFEVVLDGAPQTVVTVRQMDERPLHLLAVWDVSSSARHHLSRKRELLKNLISNFFSFPEDHLALAVFSDEMRLLTPFTADRRLALNAVRSVTTAEGATALYDALMRLGIEQLAPVSALRPVVVLLTDGGDNVSYATAEHVVTMARSLGVTLYAVRFPDGGGSPPEGGPPLSRTERALRDLCRATGGEAFFPHSSAAVADRLSDLIRQVRRPYILVFEPSITDAEAHLSRLEVRVPRRPGTRVIVQRVGGDQAL